MRPEWHVEQRVAYDTPWWRVYDDIISTPDGTSTTYIWARTTAGRGAVMCIPRTEDGRFLLLRIYRHPTRKEFWEFVAGLADEGEAPQQTALRETFEEIGIRPTEVKVFPGYSPISGFVGDRWHIAAATIPNVEVGDLTLQAEEGIVGARFVTDAELRMMVGDGQIEDGVTLAALAHLWARMTTE